MNLNPMVQEALFLESDNGGADASGFDGASPRGSRQAALYPVSLAPGSVTRDALDWYLRWADWCGWAFAPASDPWLPVGHVGPALVLGHCRPATASPPLPWPCFQPVLLSNSEYERHLSLCAPLVSGAPKTRWDDPDLVPPRAPLPERFILPSGLMAAAQFLLEYFPHLRADWERLRTWALRPSEDPSTFPRAYAAVAWLLMRRGPVADLAPIERPPERNGFPRIPSVPYSILAERGRTVWVGCEALPQPRLEDQLLDAFGDGWRIRFVLASPATRTEGEPATGGPQAEAAERAARTRLSIDPRAAEVRSSDQGPGVIRISEREIGELERYDPRRSDRDPVRVFLRELSAAIRCGASDLHLEPGLERARVRARVDGALEEWLEMSAEFGQALVGAAKEMIGLPAERFIPQDGGCTVYHGNDAISVRVSCYPIRRRRQKLALRFLPRRGAVPGLETIMPAREAGLLRHAATRPYGLILVCGPTGSGKTTTVFSTLAAINTPEKNITTMEDPVEYELEGVNQAELDPHRGVGWEPLLKGFLRQDPDAGMLGEIRDRSTAETAVRQALTGHVVFATLHTMSCARTLERLVDMGVNPDALASALSLVVSQRLVRRLCPSCRVQREPSDDERGLFERHGCASPEALWTPKSGGCPTCRGGFQGRIAAVEMLPVVEEVAGLIESRRRAADFAGWMRARRLPDVFGAALGLAARGETSLAEALEWRAVWEGYPWQP